MPYELFLALRYLYSRRRRQMTRATTLAAMIGIACGVAALIVALALSNGFRDEMRDKILRGTAHITLMRADGQAIKDWQSVIERVRQTSGVRAAMPTTYDGALLTSDNGSAYVLLRGVDRESLRAITELQSFLISGSAESLFRAAPTPDTTPIIVGAELSERLNLRLGDMAEIVSGDMHAREFAPRFIRVQIAGVFRAGLYEYDSTWVYLALPQVANLTGAPISSAPVISIETTDIYAAREIAQRVRVNLGDAYTVIDWQEANRPLFAALALEQRMGLLIIALIVFVAALNITTTLVLVVVERRADIAILSAMGARARSIMLVFIIEGACIGAIGAVAGVLLGLFICLIGDHYKLVRLPADVYSLSNVPLHVHVRDVFMAAVIAFLLSLLATIYPARAASQVRPVDALRDG
jgi:lipoprotein-releasing system permease protein